MSFNRKTIDFSYSFIILINMLSQLWDLLGFRFLIITKMSSSIILNESHLFSDKRGRLLEFCNRIHWEAKNLLKIDAFWEKFEIISPLTSKGGMAGIFLVLETIYYFPISFRSCNGIIKFFTYLKYIYHLQLK